MNLIPDKTHNQLQSIQDECLHSLPQDAINFSLQAPKLMGNWHTPAMMREFGDKFTRTINKFRLHFDDETMVRLSVLLISSQALNFHTHVIPKNLPDSILNLYPKGYEQLANRLRNPAADYIFPDQYMIKDLRFVLGLGVPGGAGILEIRSRPGRRIMPYMLFRDPALYLKSNGKIPVARFYLDPRDLGEFNEKGMYAYYQRLADLIIHFPDLYGYTCKSWFLDPALSKISPHLNFLIQIPIENGAKLFSGPASQKDIDRALQTSKTRRKLYAEGAYNPKAYTILWRRNDITAWASKSKESPLMKPSAELSN
jgi:hypothetical protein